MAYKQIHKMITFNCDQCGKEHTQRLGNYNRHEHHFCSRSCVSNYRWENSPENRAKYIKKICKSCGNEFEEYEHQTNKCECCSLECAVELKRGRDDIPGAFRKGQIPWNVGVPMSDESKEKCRQATLKQFENGMSEDHKIRMSCGQRGIALEDFDGFVTPLYIQERNAKEFREWRFNVYKRDNFTCQKCNDHGNGIILNAHHIKPWSKFKELRHELNNGSTLCEKCHKEFHSMFGKNKYSEEDWNNWIVELKIGRAV